MFRKILAFLFPQPSTQETRLRRWAKSYEMQLVEITPGRFALCCGIFRWPDVGGEDLDRVHNYLHALRHNLF